MVGDSHAALDHQLIHLTETEREPEVQPRPLSSRAACEEAGDPGPGLFGSLSASKAVQQGGGGVLGHRLRVDGDRTERRVGECGGCDVVYADDSEAVRGGEPVQAKAGEKRESGVATSASTWVRAMSC